MTRRRLSPSKISLFEMCERRWYFKEVLQLPEPENARADSGKGMHWLLKDWFINGTPPSVRPPPRGDGIVRQTEVDMVIASMPALPFRSPHLIVEEHLQFTFGGVDYHGYADLIWHTSDYAVVHDHKSTSSLGWAKDVEELLFDPQRITYGYSTGRDTLARWQYVETGKTKGEHATKLVEVFGTRGQMVDAMTWLHETYGLRMAAAYDEPEEARPQNPAACGKFGKEGCPYKYRCQIDPKQTLRSIMSLAALKAKMDAKRVEMNVESPKPPDAEPVAPPATESASSDPVAPAATAAPPVDTRTPEQQAPPKKERKQRADKGKPRGPRGANKDEPRHLDSPAALEMARDGEMPMENLASTQVTVAPVTEALVNVMAAVDVLDAEAAVRVLKAATTLCGGAP